jgi:signal transduction histidine kinase
VITETPSIHPAEAGAPPHPLDHDAVDGLALRANKLDLLERLADDLAHEIKNPLHSMVINLEVLKRRVARADAPEEVQRYIGVLAGELERVNRRIELLLRLSRPGRGAESTTLNELTEELMELVQLEARHAEAQVQYLPGPGGARVFVPREPTRQVILNLVLEVIDLMPRGGILRISVYQAEGESRLSVSDASGAVSASQANPAATRLAAAAALAEAVGGRFAVQDEDDGPALVFAVPLTPPASA